MKRSLATLVVTVAALGLVATGCGGSEAVPADSVAVVDGTEISSADLDQLMAQAKASYQSSKRDFPKVGTPEYQSIQQQYVAFLVQKTQFEQQAEELGVTITDADIDKTRDQLVKDRFGGDAKKLEQAVEAEGLTEDSFRETLRVSVLADKIFQAVTKDVEVTDAEALQAYTQSPDQFGGAAESREVRHILLSEKDKNGQIDFAKSKVEADRIYGLLQDGGDFAALAKEYSQDPGSASNGGKYDAKRGASVPEFDQAVFKLKTDQISRPVRTQFGYHVIQAISDVKPATSFEDVKAAVKATLLQAKRSETMTKWVEDLRDDYDGKINYALGFAPPDLPETTQTVTQ
jgi:parvulin-like peptidyl-prolyl isomerase